MTSLEGFTQSLERGQPTFEIAIAHVETSRVISMAIQEMIFKVNIYRKIMSFDFLCHFNEDCQFSRILVFLVKSFVFF